MLLEIDIPCFSVALDFLIVAFHHHHIVAVSTEVESGWLFIVISAVGIAVNLIGTVLFMQTGGGHGHRCVSFGLANRI